MTAEQQGWWGGGLRTLEGRYATEERWDYTYFVQKYNFKYI